MCERICDHRSPSGMSGFIIAWQISRQRTRLPRKRRPTFPGICRSLKETRTREERERRRTSRQPDRKGNRNRETDRTGERRRRAAAAAAARGGGDIKMKSHGLINTRLSRVIELSRDTEPRGAEFTKGTDHQHTLDPRRACTRARTRGPLSLSLPLSLPLPLRPSTDRARIPLAERAAAACIPLSVPFCPPSPSPIPPAGLPRPRA